MKTSLLTAIGILIITLAFSQTVDKIAVIDNTYDNASGIFGMTDHSVYEYSWFYDQWMEFPTEGLNESEGSIIINEIAVCNNLSHNPSGIYVISDTSVHVYNYYSAFWYALYNNGLEREDGKVLLSDLSVRYDVEDDDLDVFVKSGEHVYYYEWYTQQWYQLPNEGITSKTTIHHEKIEMTMFPNPVSLNSTISYTLPDNYNGNIRIAIFSQDGKLVKEILQENQIGGKQTLELNVKDFSSGIYFYEISGVNFSHVKKFIKFE
jgi:hypothetical protein